MPRPSRLEAFLKTFPENQRHDIEAEILKCRDCKAAHVFLKARYRYRGSYDSVKNWIRRLDRHEVDRVSRQSLNVAAMASKIPLSNNPVDDAMNLAQQLNSLCMSLVALIHEHQWLEPGEVRLSNREAAKILTALPSLSRAASGTILEMSRLKSEFDQKVLLLALVEEIRQDSQKMFGHEDPQLIPVFNSVLEVTRSRLELDQSTALDPYLENQNQP